EALLEVARLPELRLDEARLHALRVGGERRLRAVALLQRVESRLGGQHAALEREVDALEALRVEQARGVAREQCAGHLELRDRLPAALRDRLRAVLHHLAVVEHRADLRM